MSGQTFALILLVGSTSFLSAAEKESKLDPAAVRFFEAKVRPVLVQQCYECHSAQEGAAEGELRVDSRAALLEGGSRGPAIVVGKPDTSLLIAAVSHTDDDLQMPPKGKLSKQTIADLRRWIEMGAPEPRNNDVQRPDGNWSGFESAREHWAYQPPTSHAPPQSENSEWPRGDVDRFVWSALGAAGLAPSPDAEPAVLLRRLHFDLVGLPPSPDALNRFLKQCREHGLDDSLAEEVDRLLQSPQFGERWGRHWLDVARFAESSGSESNISFPHAWRYRDYVIDAVNADLPYDRFLTEQIAGDRLPFNDDAERARLLIATGFLAVGTKNMGENNQAQFDADVVDEQIDSLTRSIIASSVACARCHHHKFDPFRMHDYYALAGVFRSTKTYFGTHTSPANIRSGDPLPIPRVDGEQIYHKSLKPKQFEKLKEQFAALNAEWDEIEAARRAAFSGKKPEKTFTLRQVLANIWRRGPIEGKLESLDDEGQAIPLAMGVLDRDEMVNAALLARGEIGRPGEKMERGFPQALSVDGANAIPAGESGRLQLAQWLTHPQHPLTSRVFVNRVWLHLFGAGLVETVDNFGTTGAKPSHPELLDTLAVQFIADGWSLKRLVRRLVLSRTWRQTSTYDAESFRQDPENRLLWRMPKRRLEAEAIRDAMLAVAGELNVERPGGSLVARVIGDKPISLIGLDKRLPPDLDDSTHRSVYLPVIRDRLPDVLELFDFAEPSLVTGSRERTNVPVQALYLMNSPFVQGRADALASRLVREMPQGPTSDRIRHLFQICFSRHPDASEIAHAEEFLDANSPGNTEDSQWTALCQALLATAEFRNLD